MNSKPEWQKSTVWDASPANCEHVLRLREVYRYTFRQLGRALKCNHNQARYRYQKAVLWRESLPQAVEVQTKNGYAL